jgi:hypothetical protein
MNDSRAARTRTALDNPVLRSNGLLLPLLIRGGGMFILLIRRRREYQLSKLRITPSNDYVNPKSIIQSRILERSRA